MKTVMTTIRLPKDLVAKVKEKRRPHQSIAGAIEEMLTQIDELANENAILKSKMEK